jgi:very-short-patch-repair endonuclease
MRTLLDLGTRLEPAGLERAVNEADRLDLIDPEALSVALDAYSGEPGVSHLRDVVNRRTFRLTDSELERRFLLLVGDAGLPVPLTRQHLNGFRVDFFWPDLDLVVETDGLRYHRTPAQQARDRVRDQAHLAAGLTPLRFTHAQVRFEPNHVCETLLAVVRRLEKRRAA